jgi:hypothetical protein
MEEGQIELVGPEEIAEDKLSVFAELILIFRFQNRSSIYYYWKYNGNDNMETRNQ